jgi:hypothetical protein
MVLTLQKLVQIRLDEDSDLQDDDDNESEAESTTPKGSLISRLLHRRSKFTSGNKWNKKQQKTVVSGMHNPSNGFIGTHTKGAEDSQTQKLRTLQRYRGGLNTERMEYMEKHSPLTRTNQAVSAEQVSIFLTSGRILHFSTSYLSNY